MKKIFAENATGVAMPNFKKNNNYIILISLLFSALLLFSCSASKNYIEETYSSAEIVKPKLTVFKNYNNNVTLYGTVVDKDGMALKNVQLTFEKEPVALTDEQGIFSFKVESKVVKIYQIIFSLAGYNNVVRNYNTEMNDASYNIVMVKPCKCDTSSCNTCFRKTVGFNFEKESATLTQAQKLTLDTLIECLKLNPEKNINVQYNTKYPKKQLPSQRLNEVLKYFMLKGIMDYRIKKEISSEINSGAKQIEIKSE